MMFLLLATYFQQKSERSLDKETEGKERRLDEEMEEKEQRTYNCVEDTKLEGYNKARMFFFKLI